jgi:cobalt-precorrin-5B (C1)-methyltransferase
MDRKPSGPLRSGWTTGACAAAAAKSAFEALHTGRFADPVTIRLPRGERPSFALAEQLLTPEEATAGIVKDAGDDPDVTHGALIRVTVRRGPVGGGIGFRAGVGVGTVTRPGLPLAVGEPAINPGPRGMIEEAIRDSAEAIGCAADAIVTVSIPNGAELASHTLNSRLGILGGLSILGTTGIVVPYSCASWIHSIHRGIDVARAMGSRHLAGATGSTSEAAVRSLYGLDEVSLIDMGDFVGGMLKYLRRHPVQRVTLAGGIGKLAKLAQGHLDLHSGRSRVDLDALGGWIAELGGTPEIVAAAVDSGSAAAACQIAMAAGLPLAELVARRARAVAQGTVDGDLAIDICVFDRAGILLARDGPMANDSVGASA